MTLSYIRYCDDIVFLQEHIDSRASPSQILNVGLHSSLFPFVAKDGGADGGVRRYTNWVG